MCLNQMPMAESGKDLFTFRLLQIGVEFRYDVIRSNVSRQEITNVGKGSDLTQAA